MPFKFNPFTGKLDNAPGAPVFNDAKFTIFDDGNSTKKFQFEAAGISPSTTRTLVVQDFDGPVAIGYGAANQYIRGDAVISNFPVAAGGGSSVSYYFNGSVSQGTILGDPYFEINKTPAGAVQTDFALTTASPTAFFITDANDPSLLTIPQGNFTFQMYAFTSAGTSQMTVELYKYDGATFTQIGATSSPTSISNTTSDIHFLTVAVPASTTLALTDRLAVRVIGVSLGANTLTFNTEGNTASQIITTFSTGLAALNGLTDQVQFFATGTSGTDFNIASTAATHTFNIPTASAVNTGKLSSADWTTFNNKIGAGLYTATTGLTMNTARILARTTAGVGAAEEISVGTGLSLTAGVLTNTAAGVTTVTATAPLTSTGGANPDISTSMATNRIVGRSTAGTGVMEQLTPVGITVSGGNITGIGGTTGPLNNVVPRADGTGGYTIKDSGLIVEDAVVSVTGITGVASTNTITAPGTAFANGQPIRFTALTGGTGLNTTTNYFVVNVSGTDFQVETSIGGGAVNFTTNITAGTLVTGHFTQPFVALSENTTETNSSLVLSPKGDGAFILGPKPDGTAVGGNARGGYAVDLQLERSGATQVASGGQSFAAGRRNIASNFYACAIGNTNTSSGIASFALGQNSTASGTDSVALGAQASATGNTSRSLGNSTTASAIYSVSWGFFSTSDRHSMQAHAAGRFAANGDAQRARFVLRNMTTNDTATELFLDGSSTRLTIPSGKIFAFTINISGVKSDGSAVAHYLRQYALKNVAGTTTEVYAPVTIGTDNAAGTTIALSANDTNDALNVSVTGIAAETWRWVASVDAVEIAYGL
jgi:hypothetical protein